MHNNILKRVAVFSLLILFILPLTIYGGGKKEKKQETKPPVDNSSGSAERVPISELDPDAAALVNGIVIPIRTFDGQMNAIAQQYAGQGINLQPAQIAELKGKVLENLIDQELLYQDALKQGITAKDETVDEQLKAVKTQFPDEKAFQDLLTAQGVTEEQIITDITKSIIVEEYISGKFLPLVKIEDSDIRKFYDENGQYFLQPEQVRASHILIQVAPDAEESVKKDALNRINVIKTRLDKGEEFSELARTLSEGPSNVNGGDLGLFGRGQMVKPFEDAVFSMEIGDISPIVETQFGYHLIRLTAKKKETKVAFEDVKGQIVDHLSQLKMAETIMAYITTIKPAARIERLIN